LCTVLLDEHLDGYLTFLESLTFNDLWRDIAEGIGLSYSRLRDVGISSGTLDREIWRFCQSQGLYLLTDNRSQTDEDALGSIILAEGTAESLPVFTISDMDRFRNEREYSEGLVERLLEYLFDPERVLGAGRLYLP